MGAKRRDGFLSKGCGGRWVVQKGIKEEVRMEDGFRWGDMQEVAQRAKLGARSRCKVKEEEATWTGLGTPQRFHWGMGSLGEWQQLGAEQVSGSKAGLILYPDEQTSSFCCQCWLLVAGNIWMPNYLSLFSPIEENILYTKS